MTQVCERKKRGKESSAPGVWSIFLMVFYNRMGYRLVLPCIYEGLVR